ncbi:hypothetical protein KP509_01G104100 [Ceratopteris richardii]|uniref:Uncharacterized protein n=1 Tax=Ceratopteris richardii TaxID=49495 RepID=A0A8T2VSI5_CERRI|nr:hypothetical protein KP509_01G104100 [Ceratopteris richardii]
MEQPVNRPSGLVGLKNWKSRPLLWQVICSNVLQNPAEQSVVQHVVGEGLVQESSVLHQEAVALYDILSAVGRIQGTHDLDQTEEFGQVRDANSLSSHPKPLLPSRGGVHEGDGCHSSSTPEKGEFKQQKDRRINVVPSSRAKSSDPAAEPRPCVRNEERKATEKLSRFEKIKSKLKFSKAGSNVKKRDDAPQFQQQRTISSSSDKTPNISGTVSNVSQNLDAVNISGTFSNVSQNLHTIVVDHFTPLDFSEFLQDKGTKINAYDIDDVVDELRDAFKKEQVYLNQIVDKLRRALEEYLDSSSHRIQRKESINGYVQTTPADPPQSVSSLPAVSSKHVSANPDKPSSSKSPSTAKSSFLSNIVKSSKSEKSVLKYSSTGLTKSSNKQTENPPVKHITGTNKVANPPVMKERRRPFSLLQK